MPKPRIFRENGKWACWGGLFMRHGDTPLIAYDWWLSTYLAERKRWLG